MSIQFTGTIKKNGIDKYIIILTKNHKELDKIHKNLDMKEDLPKSFLKQLYEKGVNSIFRKNDVIEYRYYDENRKENLYELYHLFGKIGKETKIEKNRIFLFLYGNDEESLRNEIYGLLLGNYSFDKYKTKNKTNNKKENEKMTQLFIYHAKPKFKNIIKNSMLVATVQNEVRSLINMPANLLNSNVYSKYIKKNMSHDVKVTILEEEKLKKLGCNLIIGVNSGSQYPARMVVLEYASSKEEMKRSPIALIGKGVMFDAGGLNIKHGDFSDMKCDMAGSSIVYGIFKLLSQLNIKGHFVGFLPLVENMVDAKSIRPGDILTAYNKKTVEIIDTDAEGRLIMADALAYSSIYHPSLCIDIATLTGQAAAIFGNKSSVIMGNHQKYIQKMIESGKKNHEKIWEMPMWREFVEMTKSQIADYKNYSYETRAGTIMAGAFLSNFVPSNTAWIHLDIAGVDFLKTETANRSYGATSEILRTVLTFLSL